LVKIAVSGHENTIAIFKKCAGIHKLPIAVDNEPRIILDDGRDREALGESFRERASPNVNCKMTSARERIEPHVTEGLREKTARVIANKQNRCF